MTPEELDKLPIDDQVDFVNYNVNGRDSFNGDCWTYIPILEPDFAMHCEDWSKLAPRDLDRLLEERPELCQYYLAKMHYKHED